MEQVRHTVQIGRGESYIQVEVKMLSKVRVEGQRYKGKVVWHSGKDMERLVWHTMKNRRSKACNTDMKGKICIQVKVEKRNTLQIMGKGETNCR